MKPISITEEDIARHYKVLSSIGNLGPQPEDGFLRAPYSDEERWSNQLRSNL